MGCDGGTIPKRHELVKGPKKVEKVCIFSPLNTLYDLLALLSDYVASIRKPS